MGVHELYDKRNNGTVIVKWKEGKPYGHWDEVGRGGVLCWHVQHESRSIARWKRKQSFLHPSSAA